MDTITVHCTSLQLDAARTATQCLLAREDLCETFGASVEDVKAAEQAFAVAAPGYVTFPKGAANAITVVLREGAEVDEVDSKRIACANLRARIEAAAGLIA